MEEREGQEMWNLWSPYDTGTLAVVGGRGEGLKTKAVVILVVKD